MQVSGRVRVQRGVGREEVLLSLASTGPRVSFDKSVGDSVHSLGSGSMVGQVFVGTQGAGTSRALRPSRFVSVRSRWLSRRRPGLAWQVVGDGSGKVWVAAVAVGFPLWAAPSRQRDVGP